MWRYDYEIINGREVLTGGQAGPGMLVPLPGPKEMFDEYGKHRYIKGKDGNPVLSPAIPTADDLAAKATKDKEKVLVEEWVEKLTAAGITIDDVIAKVKEPKSVKEKT
jgi:hypothetical protein